MNNIDVDNLAQIIRQVDGNHYLGAGVLAEAILDHLPAPQIIRTMKEMEGMDPDTMVLGGDGFICLVRQWLAGDEVDREIHQRYLPGVVIAPAEQVRAARKALEKETNND